MPSEHTATSAASVILTLLLYSSQAILSKQRAETLSSVLYPDDRTYEGKELRLKQQHFFVSATIQVQPSAALLLCLLRSSMQDHASE